MLTWPQWAESCHQSPSVWSYPRRFGCPEIWPHLLQNEGKGSWEKKVYFSTMTKINWDKLRRPKEVSYTGALEWNFSWKALGFFFFLDSNLKRKSLKMNWQGRNLRGDRCNHNFLRYINHISTTQIPPNTGLVTSKKIQWFHHWPIKVAVKYWLAKGLAGLTYFGTPATVLHCTKLAWQAWAHRMNPQKDTKTIQTDCCISHSGKKP